MLRGSEILAESLLTEEKEVILPKGTVLKQEYIPLIHSLGIDTLTVEDPYEHLEKPNFFIACNRLESMIDQVQRLMERHIYHAGDPLHEFEMIANEIVKEIKAMPESVVIDMNERIPDLYEHTVMVTLLSVSVAKKLFLDEKKLYEIAIGCLLHDIGIRYITTQYVNREWNNADPMEVFEFKKHTILGYSAMDHETWIPECARKMILFHHEKQDGTGFPMRQRNLEIECKIIQVCDLFDCRICGMECQRMSIQDTIKKMKEEAGTKLDSEIVDILVSLVAHYPVGTTVKMDNQMEGVVISQTNDPENPVIMVLDAERENKKHNLMLEENISILQVV